MTEEPRTSRAMDWELQKWETTLGKKGGRNFPFGTVGTVLECSACCSLARLADMIVAKAVFSVNSQMLAVAMDSKEGLIHYTRTKERDYGIIFMTYGLSDIRVSMK